MRSKILFTSLGTLLIAALACNIRGSAPTPTPLPPPTPSGPAVWVQDDFSDPASGWGTGGDADGSLEYQSGEYVVKVNQTSLLVWGTHRTKDIAGVHLAVQASSVGEAADPAFGVVCHYQDDQNFYYLGIGADGFYAIAKYEADELTILTDEAGNWLQSDQIEQNAETYRIEADCGGGRLTLYVDGEQIASVEDPAFSSGQVGLFARSFEATGVEVRFDNFVATGLE